MSQRSLSKIALIFSTSMTLAAVAAQAADYAVPAPHHRLVQHATDASYGGAVEQVSAPAYAASYAKPFVPVAPTLPAVPAAGLTPCEIVGQETNGCEAPAAAPSAEVNFVRATKYAVQKPLIKYVEKPVLKVVTKYVDRPVIRPVVRIVEKKTRPFADFWSFIGIGLNYRTITIPGKSSDSKFNLISSDVRAGVIWSKFLGVEGRLGISGGSKATNYDCGSGYKCSLDVKAPLHGAIYARAQLPIGETVVPYALLGATYKKYEATVKDLYGSSYEKFARWDFSYGAGIEYKVNHELSVGAEYVRNGHDDSSVGINARYTF